MDSSKPTYISFEDAKRKLEAFCAYQDRCHLEVINKLYNLKVSSNIHDDILVHLIETNFLNEERFACSFARGKHRISSWGKSRIIMELKMRKITPFLIKKALQEIPDDLYFETLNRISHQRWNSINEPNILKKKQKLQAYLYRKGYEMEYIYDCIKQLENDM
ncbi:regulatory protein RecX [Myroides phaeus]|uniref:regulatory protein RecX n=1 Tax=Myroides phaeus TaxID=702745 RepID=UPI0013033955|nr:regulatory protein RecX [Myroides phaeus]